MSSHKSSILDGKDSVQGSSLESTADTEHSVRAYEALKASCDRQGLYPCNLLRRNELQSTTEGYRRYLDDEEKRLFNPDLEEIHFHELEDKGTDYRTSVIRSTPSVEKHLHQDGRDPDSRFVFIHAKNSLAQLKCSRDSFSNILTYHQVPPSFIDLVSAFGLTHYPTDYHMTGFDSDDNLAVKDCSKLLKIPTLGRSGREHRVQYLLRSVERDSASDGSRTWNIRQAAVYHTFDFIEGKALWINIKANSLLADRIKEATTDSAIINSAALGDVAESFRSTLAIHLIFLKWCDEDWRICINDCKSKVQDIIVRAQTSQVVQTLSLEEVQYLHYLGEQLESHRLVMELNHQVMRDIADRYRTLTSQHGSPGYLQEACTNDINFFAKRVERIQKNLQIRMTQIKSLQAWLQDGKELVKDTRHFTS
ncbi:hypothetical protein ACHAPU_009788 [Fusarium lateritium]